MKVYLADPRVILADMAPHRKEDETHLKTKSQASPIERFFGSYANFEYNPSRSSAEEFQRLRRSYGWRRGDPDGSGAWLDFRLALVKEFNRLFGTDPHDLLAWQTLCMFIGVRERFATCDEYVRVRFIATWCCSTRLTAALEFGKSALQPGGCD